MTVSLEFTFDGLLPVGDYEMTFPEIRESILVRGPEDKVRYPNWDAVWRLQLVDNFEILAKQLREIGVVDVYLDGSFAEDKEHPNDIDGYFRCDPFRFISGDLERELNLLDPHKVWTWNPAARRLAPGFPKRQLPMWHQYRVELYPYLPGMPTNIKDKHGNDLEFPSAFRLSRRDDKPKGIIKLGALP